MSATSEESDVHGDPTALVDTLLREVRALSEFITKARGEIAAIRPNDLKAEKLPRAGKELEAIVKSTDIKASPWPARRAALRCGPR